MRRLSLVCLALLLTLAGCHREATDTHDRGATAPVADTANQTSAAPAPAPKGKMLQFKEASGYASGDAPAGAKKPAVIVIHEWWGLDDWTKEQADRIEARNFIVVAPDLYRGKSTKDPAEAHELMRGMPPDRAVADVKAAFNYLASRPDVDAANIGVVGWCMGGGYALQLAVSEPRLAAAAINYGHLVTDPAAITKINAQILGNFGGADRGIPVDDVNKFGAALTKYGKLNDIKIYDGAGHAFMNPNNKEGYNAEAAADAQSRIDRFFERTLR